MNDYIQRRLEQIKKQLQSMESGLQEKCSSCLDELEMMQMEIEQHISNEKPSDGNNDVLKAAEEAATLLTEAIVLFEDLLESEDENEQRLIAAEITELLDEIRY